MRKEYKVLEVFWFRGGGFNNEYRGTFKSLKKAQDFVNKHNNEWLEDKEDSDCVAIGIEIEKWNEYDLENSFTAWYIED